jgi:hypothetical protein
MVKSQLRLVLAAAILTGGASCNSGSSTQTLNSVRSSDTSAQPGQEATGKMKIKIGSKLFTVTLVDTPAAAELKAKLPLTLKMSELNGNEKHGSLSDPLPKMEESPGTIRKGDFMLWQDNTLVIFYKTFKTSYSYTRLGRIDDSSGLEAAVGPADATVTFEPEN